MAQSADPNSINSILTGFVEELLTTKGGLSPSKPHETAARPIQEYEGYMRVNAADKFDVAVYIASTNFYLNQGDMQGHRARGALICYMDIEVADKLFKAAGLQVPYDEDDDSMMALCGNMCQLIADGLKNGLSAAGYSTLVFSPPAVYKNSIAKGMEFSRDQKEKQEISFYFLKHKALVVEWTMAPVPKR